MISFLLFCVVVLCWAVTRLQSRIDDVERQLLRRLDKPKEPNTYAKP